MKWGAFWAYVGSLLGLAAGLYLLFEAWTVFIPFFLGFALAYFVQPIISRFEALGLRRDRVVIVVYLILISTIAALVVLLLPGFIREAREIGQELPRYAQSFDTMISRLNNELTRNLHGFLGQKAKEFQIPFRAEHLIAQFIHSVPNNIMSMAHIIIWVIVIPFVAFFTLVDGHKWIDQLFDLTPAAYVESLLGVLAEINVTLGGYVRGQMLEGLCVGLVTMAGLGFLGFDGAILFGAMTGLMNVVPMMAPIVGGLLTLLVGYFQGMSPASLIGIFCLFVLVRLLDDFIFIPFVLGHSVRLHPVLIVFSVLAGFEVGGFVGLVLAVPFAAVVKVILIVAFSPRNQKPLVDDRHIIA